MIAAASARMQTAVLAAPIAAVKDPAPRRLGANRFLTLSRARRLGQSTLPPLASAPIGAARTCHLYSSSCGYGLSTARSDRVARSLPSFQISRSALTLGYSSVVFLHMSPALGHFRSIDPPVDQRALGFCG